MLFYNFFVTKLNGTVKVVLKNELEIEGVLISVDAFLNMKLEKIRVINLQKFPGLDGVTLCSVRGSSIKIAEVKYDEESAAALELATRYKFLKS
ncbi:U6 snRNA-associated Sm-like protein LSm2 [Conglomerata obtusa]